jgi:hypothetical protein
MDKDLYEVIADLLIRQDETIEAIKETNKRIDKTNEILSDYIGKTNETLLTYMDKTNGFMERSADFMEISTKQWDMQQKFNERFLGGWKPIPTRITAWKIVQQA